MAETLTDSSSAVPKYLLGGGSFVVAVFAFFVSLCLCVGYARCGLPR